jgi:hypothetical protein
MLSDHPAQTPEELLSVDVVQEDQAASVTPRGDVVEGAGELDAERPSHEPDVRAADGQGRTERLEGQMRQFKI